MEWSTIVEVAAVVIAAALGFWKVSQTASEKITEVSKQAGEVFAAVSNATADGKFTTDEIKIILAEVKDVVDAVTKKPNEVN